MKKFYKIFYGILAAIVILLFIMPFTRKAAFLFFLVEPFGLFIGTWSYIRYVSDIADKIIYIITLIFSIGLVIAGLIKRKRWWGHVLIVIGMLLWLSLGILGLGVIG